MNFTIAVAGKGGSGKTSISTLIVRYLLKKNIRPVLAVDADPNANFGESLGFEVPETVGFMLDSFQKEKINIPAGMTKEAYLEFRLNTLLVEKQGIDLITMGRGEGPDCYCYPNLILRKFIDRLSESYPFIVMDNEAGMEHLSRGTTQDINELLIVSNHSIKGVRTVARIKELIAQLRLRVKHQTVVINMVPGEVDPLIAAELTKLGINSYSAFPFDEEITRHDLERKSLLEMPDTAPSVRTVDKLMTGILYQEAVN